MFAPIVPPAPGRFSTTTLCPSCLPTCSITTRAMMSLALPAPSGTITVILRVGQSCAEAGTVNAKERNAAVNRRRRRVRNLIGVFSGFASKITVARMLQQMCAIAAAPARADMKYHCGCQADASACPLRIVQQRAIETRLLLVVERCIEFRERGSQRRNRLQHGVDPLLHRGEAARRGQR